MSSKLLLVVLVFGNICKTIFESIIFLFVMHPFDVGDRCSVEGVQMVVAAVLLPALGRKLKASWKLQGENHTPYVVVSALAATAMPAFVMVRGHWLEKVLGDAIEFVEKTARALKVLKNNNKSILDRFMVNGKMQNEISCEETEVVWEAILCKVPDSSGICVDVFLVGEDVEVFTCCCRPAALVCLQHAERLYEFNPEKQCLLYRYGMAELDVLLLMEDEQSAKKDNIRMDDRVRTRRISGKQSGQTILIKKVQGRSVTHREINTAVLFWKDPMPGDIINSEDAVDGDHRANGRPVFEHRTVASGSNLNPVHNIHVPLMTSSSLRVRSDSKAVEKECLMKDSLVGQSNSFGSFVNGVIKRLEEEIGIGLNAAVCSAGSQVESSGNRLPQSRINLRYLLEAYGDELGIPPTVESSSDECYCRDILENPSVPVRGEYEEFGLRQTKWVSKGLGNDLRICNRGVLNNDSAHVNYLLMEEDFGSELNEDSFICVWPPDTFKGCLCNASLQLHRCQVTEQLQSVGHSNWSRNDYACDLASMMGGQVKSTESQEYGQKGSGLYGDSIEENQTVWMSHGDDVFRLLERFSIVVTTLQNAVAVIENPAKRFYDFLLRGSTGDRDE
ncbi:hypothetical protein SUGI_1022460 [Cryptomeria japonica]|nr:hypothetical protein SUGI_1022460 [Cryptomeria japonica]